MTDETRTVGGAPTPPLVVARLEGDLERLTTVTVARVIEELDSYSAVEPAALEVSVRRNLGIAVRALAAGRAPRPEDLSEAEQTTRERFARGIPVEEIIRAFRISIALIHEHFVEICVGEGIPAAATLSGSRLLWALGDAFTTRVIKTYRALDFDDALQDAQRRTAQVRRILTGDLEPATEAAQLEAYRVDPAAEYAAVRCQADPESAERTRRDLERSGSLTARPAVIAVDGGECVGIVARRPVATAGQAIGIGPFVPLAEMPHSYQVATAACEVARRRRATGVLGMDELTWRLATVDHPEVTDFLRARYLEPLAAEADFGEVLVETVRVYLSHGLSITRSAATLVTHPNTLRYRLRRFTEITGRSLEETEVLLELLWVLDATPPHE